MSGFCASKSLITWSKYCTTSGLFCMNRSVVTPFCGGRRSRSRRGGPCCGAGEAGGLQQGAPAERVRPRQSAFRGGADVRRPWPGRAGVRAGGASGCGSQLLLCKRLGECLEEKPVVGGRPVHRSEFIWNLNLVPQVLCGAKHREVNTMSEMTAATPQLLRRVSAGAVLDFMRASEAVTVTEVMAGHRAHPGHGHFGVRRPHGAGLDPGAGKPAGVRRLPEGPARPPVRTQRARRLRPGHGRGRLQGHGGGVRSPRKSTGTVQPAVRRRRNLGRGTHRRH